MKEYFKMYGLNFVDVSPEEFANIPDKDPKVLYIIAPQNYDNYTGAYSVDLYLGNTKLGNIPEIKDITTDVWNLSEGIYKIYGELAYGDDAADKIGSLSNNQFGLLLVSKPTADSTVFTNIYDGNVYLGKTSTINGAHIKDYFKTPEDTGNKISEIDQSNINTINYVSTQGLVNYINSHTDRYLDSASTNPIQNVAVANALQVSYGNFGALNTEKFDAASFKSVTRSIYKTLFHSVDIYAKVKTGTQLSAGVKTLLCASSAWSAPDVTKALNCSVNAQVVAEVEFNADNEDITRVYITPNETILQDTEIFITGIYYSPPSAYPYRRDINVNMTNINSIQVTDFYGRELYPTGGGKVNARGEFYVNATVASGYKIVVENASLNPNQAAFPNLYTAIGYDDNPPINIYATSI